MYTVTEPPSVCMRAEKTNRTVQGRESALGKVRALTRNGGKESVFTQLSVHTLTPHCDKPEQFQQNGIYSLVSIVVCNTL